MWSDSLYQEQILAASHTGSHARLLAGPGTGKTLVITRKIQYLIQELCVSPSEILVLTFTRAAAQELRQRIALELPNESLPRIYTLHSFSLRQLLRNSDKLINIPQPLRIADDWEERYIICEDIKRILSLNRISEVQDRFQLLSSDWQSLNAEEGNYSVDPRFVGLWEEHRSIFGYTMRSELVYQLKRSLEQIQDFLLEGPTSYIVVDEYQDLNRCDLSVINALVKDGAELFVAGDDDQSIYGFRKAHPDGIRNFTEEYEGVTALSINVCKRCDPSILEFAEFVANLDGNRIPKQTQAEEGRSSGEVALLRFHDQFHEAAGIALLCDQLIKSDGIIPSDILILSRSNRNNAFSNPLENEFAGLGIPFTCDVSSHTPLDDSCGRQVISILRLLRDASDHLAWRTLLKLRKNQIGEIITSQLVENSLQRRIGFSEVLEQISRSLIIVNRFGDRISTEYQEIVDFVSSLATDFDTDNLSQELYQLLIKKIILWVIKGQDESEEVFSYLESYHLAEDPLSLNEVLRSIEAGSKEIEQEIDSETVNMLTMHKAKGLSSHVVIVMAAEDEYIPGRNDTDPDLGDERRLLYVSLTRAKHNLFVTYCNKRIRQQQRLGNSQGRTRRSLSRFLRNAPIHACPGMDYVKLRTKS